MRNIGILRIDGDCPATRGDDEIHVFHGNGAKKNFIAKNESAHKAGSVFKSDRDWSDVRYAHVSPIGDRYIAKLFRLKFQRSRDSLGNAHH